MPHPGPMTGEPIASGTHVETGPGSTRTTVPWLLLALAVAFAMRGGALWTTRDTRPILDEADYVVRAEALLDGKGFVGSFRSWILHPGSPLLTNLPQYPGAYQAPGYPAFMALVMRVWGRSLVAVKFVQVLLSTATVGLVFLIGRNGYGARSGLVAAFICAIYPNLIAFSHYLWSETLFLFLLTGGICLLTGRNRAVPPPMHRWALAGVCLGAAAMTRAIALYILPLVLLWMLLLHRQRLRRALGEAAVTAGVVVLIILPWTYRNHRITGGFVLVDTSGAFNLWRGNTPQAYTSRPAPPQQSYEPPFESLPLAPPHEAWVMQLIPVAQHQYGPTPTDAQVATCAADLAWDCIWTDVPAFLRRAKFKIIDTWNPTSFLVRHFRFAAYGRVSRTTASFISWTAISAYVLVIVLGMLGALTTLRNPYTWFVLGMILFFVAVHAVAIGLTRFRLPVMPFVIVLAAEGIRRSVWFPRTVLRKILRH
ncbi:MAG: glycosyltransferase family 39 protein [Phycisphaerae bacterium]|nr:glycosyltransferase family 39 protein [Phycisphaerae bacterium]